MRARPILVILLITAIALTPMPASGGGWRHEHGGREPSDSTWQWPITPPRVARAFVAPVDRFSAGHRGIDLLVPEATAVHAPAPGLVVFSGTVVDRGVLTIDHGDGYVTTLEPVSGSVAAGTSLDRGDLVAHLGSGGHASTRTIHFGVRYQGEYINPLVVLGGVPSSVLLPCC